MSMTTMAVAWVLANPAVTSPIIGASRPDAADRRRSPPPTCTLDADLKAKLDSITAEYRRGDAVR